MRKLAIATICVAIFAIAGCATVSSSDYVICNDLAPNVTCPDNTANVVIGM